MQANRKCSLFGGTMRIGMDHYRRDVTLSRDIASRFLLRAYCVELEFGPI